MEVKTKEKNYFYNTVVSWACILWAICSIVLVALFTGRNQTTFAIMTFGQLFIIFGIILLINKKISGVLVLFAGACEVIFPALSQWGYIVVPGTKTADVFLTILPLGNIVIGLAMMILPGMLEKIKINKCKVKVNAECVDYKETTLADEKTVAVSPTYQYEYNGKYYVKNLEDYSSRNEIKIGDKAELMINANNPYEVYVPSTKASKMITYIFGFSFFIAGVRNVFSDNFNKIKYLGRQISGRKVYI